MAHTIGPAQSALANVFLARIPETERNIALRELAALVDNNTVGLVADLTQKLPDSDAEGSLQAFLTRAIEADGAPIAASICLQYSHVREALLESAGRELGVALSLLLRQPKNGGLAVPVSELADLTPPVEDFSQDFVDRSLEDIVRIAVAYLQFMTHLFRVCSRENSFVLPHSTFSTLFGLLAASDLQIASAARDACFAFLSAFKAEAIVVAGPENGFVSLERRVWQCLISLLDHSSHSSYRTTAYAIWLRWLDLPQSFEDQRQLDTYWGHILIALASGDVEQRKTCLHILRKSVATSRNAISTKDMVMIPAEGKPGPNDVQADYERFCTVYETIVIGRYFNQAEECMKDLDALVSSQTKVKQSWLFALLEPAMSTVTQDSIRKMLGNWLMSTDLRVDTHITEFAHFLEESFLPWACIGQLFTGTLRGRTRSMQCEHGTRLASFIERLIKTHSGEDETAVRLCIAQSVLKFLHRNKTRVIPYAVVYLLEGLARGLDGDMKPCIGATELAILLDLPTGISYPEISKDVIQSRCFALAKLAVPDSPSNDDGIESTDLRLESLAQRVHKIQLGPSREDSTNVSHWKSLPGFIEELERTHHLCLSGEGLPSACRSLTALLNNTDPGSISVDQMCQVLDSIWAELDRQDYPKNTLLIMPALVLHPTIVELGLANTSVAELLISYISELHQFCAGRIYIWSPFMVALRTALFTSPAAASSFGIADLVVDTANKPPSAKVEFQLEAAAVQLLRFGTEHSREYSDYYGDHEEHGYAAFFDLVNRLPSIDEGLARAIYDTLLDPWINQKLPVPIVNKWKTTTQLQILIILQEQLLPTMTQPQARYHMEVLHKILAIEPLPRYRLLFEWQISRTIIRHPETSDDILRRLSTMNHHSNPKYLSSLARVGLMIACLEDFQESFAGQLACRLVALSASSKIIIRHEAQWSFPILWDAVEIQGWESITKNPACQALNDYIRSLERFTAPPTERQLESLDPVAGHTLSNLLSGSYLRLEPPAAENVTALDIWRLWERDQTNPHLPGTLPAAALPLGDVESVTLKTANDSLPAQATQQESKASARTVAAAALQTKGTAYLSAGITKAEDDARPTDLIVVASLVDNAYNLGGLSRISEIFGASALYMNKPKSVLANKDFISVAVASQNHLPIHDLAIENLQSFLTEKKTQGYSVVGVEQTDRSVILGDELTKLPGKTLLIMGAEKEGIPALVLGECDVLVEVPQRGVTRSMNVQTAAGVVLYEYSRQHRGR